MHPELSKQLVRQQLQEVFDTEGLLSPALQFVDETYPSLYFRFLNVRQEVRMIRFECSNYDFQAIQVTPVDPETRLPLPVDRWMTRNGSSFPLHPMFDNHPFLCLQGTRDFYLFPGHGPTVDGDRWERWRPELPLKSLLAVIKVKFQLGEWA